MGNVELTLTHLGSEFQPRVFGQISPSAMTFPEPL